MKKYSFLIIKLATIISGIYAINRFFGNYITLESIQAYQTLLHGYVDTHYILASCLFVLVYVIGTSLGMPLVVLLSLLGGFLFPFTWGLALVLLAFYLHCLLMMSVIRAMLKDLIYERFNEKFKKINEAIDKNGLVYVVFLRTSLVLPSFIINCAAAMTSINIWTFSITSVLASIPILSVLVYSGKMIGDVDTLWDLYSPQLTALLVALALTSASMALFQTWKEKRK